MSDAESFGRIRKADICANWRESGLVPPEDLWQSEGSSRGVGSAFLPSKFWKSVPRFSDKNLRQIKRLSRPSSAGQRRSA